MLEEAKHSRQKFYNSSGGGKGMPFIGAIRITLPFNAKREYWTADRHTGIDLVGDDNKDVLAVDNGTVTIATSSDTGYGKRIFIKHPDGTGTLYAHLASFAVAVNDNVVKGQKIGVMGATGNVTGAHLHFEAHNNTEFVYNEDLIDPAIYLNLPVNKAGDTFKGEKTSNYNAASTQLDTLSSGYLEALVGDGTQYSLTGDIKRGALLYGRKYRVMVRASNTTALDVSDLHCKFEIVKNAFLAPNTSKVQIYNLSPQTENAIIKEGQSFIVEAGYQGGDRYGVIFNGEVVQPLRYKENGTDYVLQLIGMDGFLYSTYSIVGASMIAGQTQRDIINKCASAATITTPVKYISPDISDNKLPRGKVLFGLARDYLAKIAKTENASYCIDDGDITIVKADDTPLTEIIRIDSESGMIGNPEQTQYGVRVKMLLNPRIKINSLVAIDNRTVRGAEWRYGEVIRALDSEGIYKVIKITHTGDTRGDEWYTEVETVAQAGLEALPEIMANNTTFIY